MSSTQPAGGGGGGGGGRRGRKLCGMQSWHSLDRGLCWARFRSIRMRGGHYSELCTSSCGLTLVLTELSGGRPWSRGGTCNTQVIANDLQRLRDDAYHEACPVSTAVLGTLRGEKGARR